jgi:hypothetical protein
MNEVLGINLEQLNLTEVLKKYSELSNWRTYWRVRRLEMVCFALVLCSSMVKQ